MIGIKKWIIHTVGIGVLLVGMSKVGYAQPSFLSLSDVIRIAQEQSIDVMVVQNEFLSGYWSYRAYKASRLPSLNFQSSLGNLNRSLVALQDYNTGNISYRKNFNMINSGSLSIDQNISATGGTLSLSSSISRLDQYYPNREVTYYSQPLTISYLQPLWSFNSFKWDRKLEPEKYEQAKRSYLENMEAITLKAVTYYFDMALEQLNLDIARNNYRNTKTMYEIARQRFELGSVKQDELMQLELAVLNDSLAINTSLLQLRIQQNKLRSFLGFTDRTDLRLVLPDDIPDMEMNFEQVYQLALTNSTFSISQKISALEADMGIAKAKGDRGISVQLSTQFGLSQSAEKIRAAYMNLLDREVIGLSLRVPIMDWGSRQYSRLKGSTTHSASSSPER